MLPGSLSDAETDLDRSMFEFAENMMLENGCNSRTGTPPPDIRIFLPHLRLYEVVSVIGGLFHTHGTIL